MSRHIVIVNDYAFINGGAGKIAIATAIGLAERGEDVFFFSSVGPVCDELKTSKVKTICLGQQDINHKSKWKVLTEGINNILARKKFKELLDSFESDEVIVHIHSWTKALSSSIFTCLKHKKNIKSVVTLHDYFSVCPNGGLYDYKHKHICHIKSDLGCLFCNCDKRNYLQKLFRYVRYKKQKRDMNSVSDFIFISQLNKAAFLSRRTKKCRLFYVQNYVKLSKLVVNHPETNDFYIYVGRISEEKGVDYLCQALTELGKKGYIVGDGPLLSKLKNKYPNLVFTGWLNADQMVPYILKSRAFVFPSKWYEGSPLIIPEMISYGLPCLLSTYSSASELADFDNSVFFDSVESLKKCLMAKQIPIPKLNRERFSLNSYLSNIMKVYEEL